MSGWSGAGLHHPREVLDELRDAQRLAGDPSHLDAVLADLEAVDRDTAVRGVGGRRLALGVRLVDIDPGIDHVAVVGAGVRLLGLDVVHVLVAVDGDELVEVGTVEGAPEEVEELLELVVRGHAGTTEERVDVAHFETELRLNCERLAELVALLGHNMMPS